MRRSGPRPVLGGVDIAPKTSRQVLPPGWDEYVEPRFPRHEDCPDAGRRHTPQPTDYVARAEDGDARIARGQYQERCPTCGFWAVWRTRAGRRAQGSGP